MKRSVAALVLVSSAACASYGSARAEARTAAVPPSFQPASATFVSAKDGWVLGTATCPTGRCPVLASTTDAANTWHTRPAPPAGLRQIRFATARRGYAFDPGLATTTDGVHWHRTPVPGGGAVSALEVSPTEAYLVAGGHLYESPVGRSAWTQVDGVALMTRPPGPLQPVSLAVDVPYGSTRNGLVAGADGTVWVTTDGTRWAAQSVCTGTTPSVAVASVTNGFFVVVCSGAAGRSYHYGLQGSDPHGPVTFSTENPPSPFPAGVQTAAEGTLNDGLASGAEGVLRLSSEQGSSEVSSLRAPARGGHWSQFTGIATGEAFAIAVGGTSPRLWFSRDYGQHWALQSFTSATLPPACSASQLRGHQGGVAAALGNTTAPVVVTNMGAACELMGYPSLRLVSSSPVRLEDRSSSYIVQERPLVPVVLRAHGGTASFFLSGTDNPPVGRSCPEVSTLLLTLRGASGRTATLTVPAKLVPCFDNLEVSPWIAGRPDR